MAKDTFFFEEDPEASDDSSLTWAEHTDTFMSVLKDKGFIKEHAELFDLEKPMTAESALDTKHVKNGLLDIEFGIVAPNYVIHITPIHPRQNLTGGEKLNQAVRAAVVLLNQVIPVNLSVSIFLPRADFQIKAVSFIIKDGAGAWNLDAGKIETEVVPELVEQIGKICMQP